MIVDDEGSMQQKGEDAGWSAVFFGVEGVPVPDLGAGVGETQVFYALPEFRGGEGVLETASSNGTGQVQGQIDVEIAGC